MTYQTPLQKAAGFSGLPKAEQVRRAYLQMKTAEMLLAAARTLTPEMLKHA